MPDFYIGGTGSYIGDAYVGSGTPAAAPMPVAPVYDGPPPTAGLLTAALPFLFFVPLVVAAPPYDPADLAWTPRYENVLEQPYSLHTTEPGIAEEDTPYGWPPIYPDSFVAAAWQQFSQPALSPAVFWSTFTPAVAQNVDTYGWRPSYPDFARAEQAHASAQKAYFRPDHPLAASPPLAWSPVYPDRAEGARGLHASQQRAYFRPEHPLAASPSLAWKPSYPDAAGGPSIHASLQVWWTGDLRPIPTAVMGWHGSWPDLLNRNEVHPSQILAYFKNPTPMPAAPPLSWGPVYPSRVDPPRALDVALQRAVFFDPFPITIQVASMGWRGQYPAWIPRLEVHASQQVAYFKNPTPLPAAPALSWRPQYPVWIEPPQAILTAQQRPFFFDPFPIAVPVAALGWRGSWPDSIDRIETHASRQLAYFKSPLPMPAAPLLSWRGEQPVWLPPGVLHAAHRPALFRAPNVEIVPLAWAADYPDQMHRAPWRELSYTVTPYLVTPIDQFGWRGQTPIYIPRIDVHPSRVPSVFLPEGFQPAQTVPVLAWAPVYPDFARGDTIFRLELVAYLGTQTITPLPFAVEARNVVLAVPTASGLVIIVPTAEDVVIQVPTASGFGFTPSE